MREESEREIQDRIESTRERMGETIERIGDRVNPYRIKENVKMKARSKMRDVEHEVNETGRGIWRTIRDNPLPAGMVGVGLAWLVANGSSGSREPRYPDTASGRYGKMDEEFYGGYARGYVGASEFEARSEPFAAGAYDLEEEGRTGGMKERVREKGEHAMESAREKGEHVMESAREKGERVVDSAREKGSELAHRAEEGAHEIRDRARHWADEAQYRARRAERRVEDSVRENPLAAGAVAAALGFAAGLMIPETQKEREVMGRTRERVMDRAEETVRRAGRKAKDVARETAGESAKAAVDEIMDGGRSEREAVSEPGR